MVTDDERQARRRWSRSFGFAVVFILLAVGCIALAVGLLLWAILPAIGINAN
jgi:hypothetical protein